MDFPVPAYKGLCSSKRTCFPQDDGASGGPFVEVLSDELPHGTDAHHLVTKGSSELAGNWALLQTLEYVQVGVVHALAQVLKSRLNTSEVLVACQLHPQGLKLPAFFRVHRVCVPSRTALE